MKPLLLVAAVSVLPLVACNGAKAPRAALDCPTTQGALSRTAMAADGKTCTYASADGAEVTLRLIPVSGGPYATLDRLEATLLAQADVQDAAGAKAVTDVAASPRSAEDARRIAEEAARDAVDAETSTRAASDQGVDVHMEDGNVVVAEGGDTTRINLPGIRIEANESDDSASVRIGPLHVDANGDEAVMRVRRDVRLKGEALSREKRGVRATFMVGDRKDGNEGMFLGYEAGGPKGGPLAVAVVRGNGDLSHGDDLYDDVKRLVRKNGGV